MPQYSWASLVSAVSEGKGYPLQYSGLEKSMDCIVHELPESYMTERLSLLGFPDSSVGKESTCNAGDPSSIPELRRSPGEGIGYTPVFFGFHYAGDLGSIPGLERYTEGGHGNPLQYSCLENPHGCGRRGAWQATVHRVRHG